MVFLDGRCHLWVEATLGGRLTWQIEAAPLSQHGEPTGNVLFPFPKGLAGLSLPQHSYCITFIQPQFLKLGNCLCEAASCSRGFAEQLVMWG